MSDILSRELARLSKRIGFEHLEERTVHEVKRRVLDSFACLFAGYREEVSVCARALAQTYPASQGATIIGTRRKAPAEIAGFANGTAVRSLDFNDTYLSVEPLHPSDVIAPLLALAEEEQANVERFITAVALAYEVGVILCDSASLKANGWDHVNYITVAAVVGGAHLLRFSEEDTEQALALAVVPHAAMRQTRNGEISMWKGAAAANAARNALFALKLAKWGMKGPYEPFAGSMGFNAQLLKGGLDLEKVAQTISSCRQINRIQKTHIKKWPVEYMTQAAIEAALELRKEFGSLDEVERIEVQTFQLAYDVLAKDPQKWAPKTRETADHSLPYIVVAALEDGKIDLDTFAPGRIQNETTLRRMQNQVSVRVSEALTAEYPDGNPTLVTLRLKDGRVLEKKVKYPAGHAGKPMTDKELERKFKEMTRRILPERQQEEALQRIWSLERQRNYSDWMESLVVEDSFAKGHR